MLTDYRPEAAASALTWLDPVPVRLPSGQAMSLRLRAVNRSAETWELKPGDLAGIHLLYTLSGPDGRLARDRAGLVRRSIPPGGAHDFTLVIPALPTGRYVLTAELLDARGAGVPIRASSFVKMGDEAAQAVLDVR